MVKENDGGGSEQKKLEELTFDQAINRDFTDKQKNFLMSMISLCDENDTFVYVNWLITLGHFIETQVSMQNVSENVSENEIF